MKVFLLVFLMLFNYCYAQHLSCIVNTKELQGTYEGECKNGKAHGKGKAVGDDAYEGQFKNGNLEGTGKYNWKNGTWYEGSFKNGLKDGEGIMHFVTETNKDSLITGFWKKGSYIGLYESPYKIVSKSYMVKSVSVSANKLASLNEIEVTLESITGGSIDMHGDIPKLILTDIQIFKGSYQDLSSVSNMQKKNIYTLKNVIYPFSASFRVGQDEVVIDFNQPGSWSMNITMRQ